MAIPKITKRIFYGNIDETQAIVLNNHNNGACTAEKIPNVDTLKVGQELSDKVTSDAPQLRINNLNEALNAYYETIFTPSIFKSAIDKLKQATHLNDIAPLFKRFCNEIFLSPSQILEIAKEKASTEQLKELNEQKLRIDNQLKNELDKINPSNTADAVDEARFNFINSIENTVSIAKDAIDDQKTSSSDNTLT